MSETMHSRRSKVDTSARTHFWLIAIPTLAIATASYAVTADKMIAIIVAIAGIIVAAPLATRTTSLGAAAVLILLTGTPLIPFAAAPVVFRATAVVVLAAMILLGKHTKTHARGPSTTTFPLLLWSMLLCVGVLHSELPVLINATFGLAALLLLAQIPVRALDRETILKTWWFAIAGYCTISLALKYISPAMAIENLRLRGLAENANTLGFFAMLLVVLTLVTEQRLWTYLVTMVLAGPILFLTASRASIASTLIALGVAALCQVKYRRGIIAIGAFLGLILLARPSLLTAAAQTDALRRNNSRLGTIEETRRALDISPWTGIGFNGLESTVASSPLRALAVGGILAGAIGTLAIIVLLRSMTNQQMLLYLSPCLTHSLLEGWMVSTSGPIIMTFFSIWAALMTPDTMRQNEDFSEYHLLAKQPEHPSRTTHSRTRGPARRPSDSGSRHRSHHIKVTNGVDRSQLRRGARDR